MIRKRGSCGAEYGDQSPPPAFSRRGGGHFFAIELTQSWIDDASGGGMIAGIGSV